MLWTVVWLRASHQDGVHQAAAASHPHGEAGLLVGWRRDQDHHQGEIGLKTKSVGHVGCAGGKTCVYEIPSQRLTTDDS